MLLFKYELSKIFRIKAITFSILICVVICFLIGVLSPCNIEEDYYDSYKCSVEEVIYNARINYLTVADKNSEISLYQKNIINYYSKTIDIALSDDVKCFSSVLSSSIPYALTLFFGILSAFHLAYTDKKNNLVLLVECRRHSRSTIFRGKILALFCFIFALLITFVVSTYVGGIISFSSGDFFSKVQSLQQYCFCPYNITILEALFLRIIISYITILWISLMVLALTISIRKPYIICLIVTILIGADIIRKILFKNNLSLGYNYGILNLISDDWLQQYHGVKIFSSMISQPMVGVTISFSLSIAFAYIAYLVCIKHNNASIAKRKYTPKNHFTRGIWYYEFKKCLSCRPIIIILVAISLHIITLSVLYKSKTDDFNKIYKYYLSQMSDMTFEEQKNFAIDLRIRSNEIKAEAANKKQQFIDGNIPHEEYTKSQQEAGIAELTLDVLSVIDKQLNSLEKLNDEGVEAQLVYSIGWEYYCNLPVDYYLIIILLLFSLIYNRIEQQSGISKLLNPIHCGNERLVKQSQFIKNAIMFSIGFLYITLFNIVDYAYFRIRFELPNIESYAAGAGILYDNKYLKLWEIVGLKYLGCILGTIFIFSTVITICRVYDLLINNRYHHFSVFLILFLDIVITAFALFYINLLSCFGVLYLNNYWGTNFIYLCIVLSSLFLCSFSIRLHQHNHISIKKS